MRYSSLKVIFTILLLVSASWPIALSLGNLSSASIWNIDESNISPILTTYLQQNHLPNELVIEDSPYNESLKIQYTLDYNLQKKAEQLLTKYKPDYGIIVAISPENGNVLAMAQSARDGLDHGNLTLRNTYPAASIAKIITAVAVVNEEEANKNTVFPFNGKTTSLYKTNVFRHKKNRWTRNFTLEKAFSKSANTIFGRIGAVYLGGEKLADYVQRLGFNGHFDSDFQFDSGQTSIDYKDEWQVAELASGYTRNSTLSPLHGAILAATAVNGGKLVTPNLIKSLINPDGIHIYHQTLKSSQVMDKFTAEQLKSMMLTTVRSGTARSAFKRFHRKNLKDVKVGGKTGSLSGFEPKGKYDWFVGFAERGEQKIAYAVLCINKEKWYVKSTKLARDMLTFFFQEPIQAG